MAEVTNELMYELLKPMQQLSKSPSPFKT